MIGETQQSPLPIPFPCLLFSVYPCNLSNAVPNTLKEFSRCSAPLHVQMYAPHYPTILTAFHVTARSSNYRSLYMQCMHCVYARAFPSRANSFPPLFPLILAAKKEVCVCVCVCAAFSRRVPRCLMDFPKDSQRKKGTRCVTPTWHHHSITHFRSIWRHFSKFSFDKIRSNSISSISIRPPSAWR